MEISKHYEELFKQFREENPTWLAYLTNHTYYEIMDWYDAVHGLMDDLDNSIEAKNFATYVWNSYVLKDEVNAPSLKDRLKDFLVDNGYYVGNSEVAKTLRELADEWDD